MEADSLARAYGARVAELERGLTGSQDSLQAAREALTQLQSEPGGGPRNTAEIEALRRRLQETDARVERFQLGSMAEFELIENAVGPSVAKLTLDLGDGTIATGTGFLVRDSRTLMTAGHLFDSGAPSRIAVQFAGAEEVIGAHLVHLSQRSDVAVLRLRPTTGTPRPIDLNRAPDTIPPGSPVAAIGFPLGGASSTGVDARAPEPLLTIGLLESAGSPLLRFHGYGTEGSSGSPVLDRDGKLIGLLVGGSREARGRLLAEPTRTILEALGRS